MILKYMDLLRRSMTVTVLVPDEDVATLDTVHVFVFD
jgi:hypothetical protein